MTSAGSPPRYKGDGPAPFRKGTTGPVKQRYQPTNQPPPSPPSSPVGVARGEQLRRTLQEAKAVSVRQWQQRRRI